MIRASLLVATLSGVVAAGATAQADSTVRDTTARKDSTARDTTTKLLPAFPLPIAPGPLPAGSRYTFTADSLLFTNARTLSDLLNHIPGVYVARGGWYGQAEPVLFGGRGAGAAAIEVYWDGAPYLSIGRDSLALDPARIPLAPLERVDVVVLPALLRVYLVTARQRSTAPLTQIGILNGVYGIAGYRGGYAARSRGGFGVSFVFDQNNIDGNPGATTTNFSSTDLWLKAEFIPPDGRLGASFQLLSSTWHRREAAAGVGRMRRSLPTLRGRRDSSRPDPAGALAAVIARAAACFDSGPGARCPSGSTCRSPRSGRGAKPPFRTTDSGDPAGRRHAISAVRRGYDVEVG